MEGRPVTDSIMVPIYDELSKHGLSGQLRTTIYNRIYEKVDELLDSLFAIPEMQGERSCETCGHKVGVSGCDNEDAYWACLSPYRISWTPRQPEGKKEGK